MAAGSELTQSLESSASTKTGGIEGRAIGADTPEVYYSAVTSKKPATCATAVRSALSAPDASASLANAVYTSILTDVGNSIHIAAGCRFSSSGTSCRVFFALYDANSNVIGITKDYIFTASAYTDGTLYVSELEIIDIHSASKIVPVLKAAPDAGNVSIFVELL